MSFSKDFLWGAASAAAQVEGAYLEDGKCLSIWDVADGHIKNNETCHVACDHYHRYQEDVALMKALGLKSYRFSVSMCRVMPEEGRINPEGLAFYKDLSESFMRQTSSRSAHSIIGICPFGPRPRAAGRTTGSWTGICSMPKPSWTRLATRCSTG